MIWNNGKKDNLFFLAYTKYFDYERIMIDNDSFCRKVNWIIFTVLYIVNYENIWTQVIKILENIFSDTSVPLYIILLHLSILDIVKNIA